MNSTITYPTASPEKLPRPADHWEATLDEERRRLQEDLDSLREREQNLREYEARLRAWQAEIDAGRVVMAGRPMSVSPFARVSSQNPFCDDTALQTAWEKLHRARELLEAELNHLRDDRITLKDQQDQLKRREQLVAERETRLAQREALLAAAVPVAAVPATPAAGPAPVQESAVTRFTRGPFEIARSVFGKK